MDSKTERGIPVPDNVGHRGRPSKYPWYKMGVGDSILFSPEGGMKARRAAQKYGERNGGKIFASRMTDGGIRVWRAK